MQGHRDSPSSGSQQILAPGLLLGNHELENILREVDEVCKTLKKREHEAILDARILEDALMLAIRCAIDGSFLRKELSLSLIDDLTGLHDRRGFMALAEQQLKTARRNSRGMILFFADIDDLKKINDDYGPREGDLALVRAANTLTATFRSSDIAARLGGDEFAILALEASDRDEKAILRRIDEILRKSNLKGRRCDVSLSVGSCHFNPEKPAALNDLIARAEEAMHGLKRACNKNGRAPSHGRSNRELLHGTTHHLA